MNVDPYRATCVCGDLIEQIERSNHVVDWVHVDRPRRNHAAVPAEEGR